MKFSSIVHYLCNVAFLPTIFNTLRWGRLVIVGRGAKIRVGSGGSINLKPGAVLMVGVHVDLPRKTLLKIRSGASLNVSGKVMFMKGTVIRVEENAVMNVQGGAIINENSRVYCHREVNVGESTLISGNVTIMDYDHHTLKLNGEAIRDDGSPIIIENNVWIGFGVTILKGVTIGSGSVVSAGTLVNRDILPSTLNGGISNRAIADNISWE